MFRTVDLVKTYEHRRTRVEALKGVSLDIPDGEVYGIIGRSGAGKSTLIRCLNLLEKPTSGQVVLDDVELSSLPAAQLRRHRQDIGMVFQHFHLLSSRTLLANVAFPLEIQGVGRRERLERAQAMLDVVGLADRADDHPSRLSGGQKQRVGIARALVGEPRVLLCDEATSALDSETTEQILSLLAEVNARLGVTVVLITHEMAVLRRICGSAALLEDGRLVESGRLIDLLATPGSSLGAAILPFTPAPVPPGQEHLVVTLPDADAMTPVLSRAARALDVDLRIVGGGVDQVAGHRVGRFQLAVDGGEASAVTAYLRQHGLTTQSLGPAPHPQPATAAS